MDPTANVAPGSIVITPSDMYKEMQEVARQVARLTTIVDPALQQLRDEIHAIRAEKAVEHAKQDSEHERTAGRVSRLENWRWFLIGVATVWGPTGGYLLTVLTRK